MKTNVKAYAKINLALNVLGIENGFHTLDTLVCSINLFDSISLSKRKDKEVTVNFKGFGEGYMKAGDTTNAYKAAKLFIETFGVNGADIEIKQNIPKGSGMGGSSADLSGVLCGMQKLYKTEYDLKPLADKLGSDSGYMLEGGYARLTGRGEKIEPLTLDTKLYFVIVLNDKGVNTAECYKTYDNLEFKPECADIDSLCEALKNGELEKIKDKCLNALYPAATVLEPAVKEHLEAVKELSPSAASMTGSGASVFGIFETKELAEWAAEKLWRKFDKVLVAESFIPNKI